MKRDIKFKAFDRHNKVWLGPYTLRELAFCDQFNYDTEVKPVCSRFEDYDWVQFVGTFSGVEVWEGDVVHAWTPEADGRHSEPFIAAELTGVVEYYDNAFCIVCNGVYNEDWTNAENIEVLGNIFEHPGLLQEQANETEQ